MQSDQFYRATLDARIPSCTVADLRPLYAGQRAGHVLGSGQSCSHTRSNRLGRVGRAQLNYGLCCLRYPPGNWAFLAVRLPIRHINGSDPVGVSVFHTRKIWLGLGVLYTPGAAVSTRPQCIYDRRLPLLNGSVPVCPAQLPDPDSLFHEASARIPGQSPHASLPLTCDPRTEQGPSGFAWASHPTGPDRPHTPRWGRVTDTDSGPRLRHQSTSNRRTRLQRATSRRNARKRCTRLRLMSIFANRIVPDQVHLSLHLCPLCPGVSPTHLNVRERRRLGPALPGDPQPDPVGVQWSRSAPSCGSGGLDASAGRYTVPGQVSARPPRPSAGPVVVIEAWEVHDHRRDADTYTTQPVRSRGSRRDSAGPRNHDP